MKRKAASSVFILGQMIMNNNIIKIKADSFLFMTNSDKLNEWEEVSPGVFEFKGVKCVN